MTDGRASARLPISFNAHAAAYAAGEQSGFWDDALPFYQHQGVEGRRYLTGSYLLRIARQGARPKPRTLAT